MPSTNDHRIYINHNPGLANPSISVNSCVLFSADHPGECGGCDRRNITIFFCFNFSTERRCSAPDYFNGLLLCYDCANFRLRTVSAARLYNRMRRWAQRERRRERAVRQTQLRYTATATINVGESWLHWGPMRVVREEDIVQTAPEGLLAVHRRGYALGTRQRMDCMEIRNGRYAMHISDDIGRTHQRPFRVYTVQGGTLAGARVIKIEHEGYLDGWRAIAALPIRAGQPIVNYNDRLEPALVAPIMEALTQGRSIHHCCILCNERTRLGHFCRDHSGMALQMMTTRWGWNYIGQEFDWGYADPLGYEPPRSEIREQLVQ